MAERLLMEILDEDYLTDLIKKTYGLRLHVKIGYFANSVYVSETNTREGRIKIYSCDITKERFFANIMRDFLFS